MHMRRRYQLRRTRRIPIHHGEHISVVGPSDAIAELNQLTRRDPNLLRQAGIERLGSERAGAAPPIRAYADGRWQPQALPRQIDTELSIQVYDCKLQPNVTLPDAIDKLKSILADREEESLKKITVCVDPTVDAPYESSDSPYESSDSHPATRLTNPATRPMNPATRRMNPVIRLMNPVTRPTNLAIPLTNPVTHRLLWIR